MKPILSTISICIFCCVFSFSLRAEESVPLFPLKVSTETPANIMDFSTWNSVPAGNHGFIRVENGQFVHDKGRFLIWGTNVCALANFPEKKDAEKIAKRLAWLGFNCVRMHHLDNGYIWGEKPKSQLTFDPERLDKLDYFIYQLKNQGIYVNLNLHVSRTMDDRDGFPHKELRPRYDKGLDNFYPPLIDVLKKFSKDLLEHVNPYTKTAYKDEPCVAALEINNENSVVREWTYVRELMNMPEPYASVFQEQWNDFLRTKYGSTRKLAEAWNCLDMPLGDEMLKNGDEVEKWRVETGPGAKFKKTNSQNVLTMKVQQVGQAERNPQLIADDIQFDENKVYRFSMRVRSDKPSSLRVHACLAYDPWTGLGLHDNLLIGPEWKTFSYSFRPRKTEDRARIVLTRFKPGETEIADATLKLGGTFGLYPGESIENGTVPIIAKNAANRTKEAIDDFCEFLFKIEENYWLEMYRFLKDEIKVKQPISGTQLHYGSTSAQAKLDYIDIHRYWNHPVFLGGTRWGDWYMGNRALVNHADREVFPQLATARVHGMPYVVSEFDSPFPSQYSAETLPMLAAFARFQDWDGIYQFSFSHSRDDFAMRRWASAAFDMTANPAKLAHLPVCVAFFRRGDILKAKTEIVGAFDKEKELALFKKEQSTRNFSFEGLGLDPLLALFYRTSLDLSGKRTENIPSVDLDLLTAELPTTKKTIESGRLHWAQRLEGRSFLADSEHSILFSGFSSPDDIFKDRTVSGVDLKLTGKTRLGWTTISLVSVNENGFGKPEMRNDKPIRVLVTATGLLENPEVKISKLDGDRITSPDQEVKSVPFLCEGVPLEVRFRHAKSIRCFALDEAGNRGKEIETTNNSVELKPEYKTIRYEIEILESFVK